MANSLSWFVAMAILACDGLQESSQRCPLVSGLMLIQSDSRIVQAQVQQEIPVWQRSSALSATTQVNEPFVEAWKVPSQEQKFFQPRAQQQVAAQSLAKVPMPHFVEKDDAIQVVVISDRSEALVGSIGSLMLYTHYPTVVNIISRNLNLEQELEVLLQTASSPFVEIKVITYVSVLADLRSQKIVPVWEWPTFGASLKNSDEWLTDNSVRVDRWDNLTVHSNPMNLLRFYLPHLKQFTNLSSLVFMDDDIIVKGDLAQIRDIKLKKGTVQLATCSLWKWGGGKLGKCETFGLFSRTPLDETDFMYLNGHSVSRQSPQYTTALIDAIRDVNGISHPDLHSVDYWNYGFVKMNITEWHRENLTQRFEKWMTRNYADHIFPEYSLSYGLGISQLMLMGKVQCWDDVGISISDGLGYVTDDDYIRANLSLADLESSFVLHWSGTDKPFVSTPPQSFRYQWNNVLTDIGAPIVLDLHGPEKRQKALLVTDTASGAEWFMDLLEQHPRLCASSGGLGAFPRESLITGDLDNLGINYCSRSASCTWGFTSQWVPVFYQHRLEYCSSHSELALWLIQFPNAGDVYRFNRHRMCMWVDLFHERALPMTPQNLFDTYLSIAFSDKSKAMLGCTCPIAKDVQIQKFVSDWWVGDQQKSEDFDPRIFDVPLSQIKPGNMSTEIGNRQFRDFRVQDGYLNRLRSPELQINFSEFTIVSLSRENVFESYVLAQMAEQVARNPNSPGKQVKVRLQHMLHYIEDAIRLRPAFFKTLQSMSDRVLQLSFEECVIDPQGCVKRAQVHLNVSEQEIVLSDSALTFKDEDVMQYVSNVEEVKHTLLEYGFGRWIKDHSVTASLSAKEAQPSSQLHFVVPSLKLAYRPAPEAEKPSYWWDGSSDRLVFLHIHRTGGSTLSQLLGGSDFATINISGQLLPRHLLKASIPCLPDATCKIQNFAADVMDGPDRAACWDQWPGATAHFILRLRELQETNCRTVELHHFDISATMPFTRNGYKVITIVREPISHLMSRFEYELLRRWNWTGQLTGEPYNITFERFAKWTGFQTSPQEALRYFTGCTNARVPDPQFDLIEEKLESQSVGLCRYEYLDGYAKFETVASTAASMIPIALKTARDQIATLLIFEAWNPSLELVSKKHSVPFQNELLHLNSVHYQFDFKLLPVESQRRLRARLLPDTIFYQLMAKRFADDANKHKVDLTGWYAACRCSSYRAPAERGSVVCEHRLSGVDGICMPARSDGTCELDQVRCVEKESDGVTKASPSFKEMFSDSFHRKVDSLFNAYQRFKIFMANPFGLSQSPLFPSQAASYEYMALNDTYCGGSRSRIVVGPGNGTLDEALTACDAMEGCLCVSTYLAKGSTSGWELTVYEEPTDAHQQEMDTLLWSTTAKVKCGGAQSWLAGDVRCFLRQNADWFTFQKTVRVGQMR